MENSFEGVERNAERLHNEIQIDLANLYFETPKATDEQLAQWVGAHSKKFAAIIADHPEYLALYVSHRDEALEELGALLYDEHEQAP